MANLNLTISIRANRLGTLTNLGMVFLAVSITILIMQPIIAPTFNQSVATQQGTEQIQIINGTEVRFNFAADASIFFLKYGIYPVYWPSGKYFLDAFQIFLALGVACISIDLIRHYLNRPDRDLDELDSLDI